MLKVINGVKYYPVSEEMKFNLAACYDKYSVMMYEAEENDDFDRYEELSKLRDEAQDLSDKVSFNNGWLSGKDYGKAKEFVTWRIEMRIQANLEAGNSKYLEYC